MEALKDPHKAEIEELKNQKVITYPFAYRNTPPDPYLHDISISYSTNETFSVGNSLVIHVNGTLTNPNIIRMGILTIAKNSDFSWENNFNATKNALEGASKQGHYKEYDATGRTKYILQQGFTPTTEDPNTTILVLLTKEDKDLGYQTVVNGTRMEMVNETQNYYFSIHLDFPTIYPYTAKLQAETNRAIQRQALESDTANNDIEGLTLMLTGFVPIGLVIEFWIEYAIENQFYRKEKTEPWNCDWFSNRENYRS